MARLDGVGVAFCGGGFRSFAEVAAIEDMECNDVRIAAAAGTSMGSMVAVLTAAGLPSSRIEELLVKMDRRVVEDGFLKNMQFKVLNMVKSNGFLDSGVMEGYARDILGEAGALHMDDLKMPVAIPAVDITTGQLCVFTNDPDLFGDPNGSWACLTGNLDLAKCVTCSASYPLAVTPTQYLGRTFMDGGCRMNLPTPLFDRGSVDAVVGVGLIRSMSPLESPAPIDIARRTMACGANQLDRLYSQAADVYVNLPVSGDDAFQAGTGRQVIDEARAMLAAHPVDWVSARPSGFTALRRAALDALAKVMRPQGSEWQEGQAPRP